MNNTCQIADDIISIFESHGFSSSTPPDVELLRHLIVEAIEGKPSDGEDTLDFIGVHEIYTHHE